MRILKYITALAIIVASGLAAAGNADESQTDPATKSCLTLWMIDNIDIVDEQTIVFNTRSGDHLLNRLPHTCPMLDRNRAIMYKTPLSSLCKGDIITVLDVIGGGFQSLGACGLGKFQQIPEEEFRLLKGKPDGK